MKGTDKVLDGFKVTHLCLLLQYRCLGKELPLVGGTKLARNMYYLFIFIHSATNVTLDIPFTSYITSLTYKHYEVDLLHMRCIYFLFNICYLESFVCITSEVDYEYGCEVYY